MIAAGSIGVLQIIGIRFLHTVAPVDLGVERITGKQGCFQFRSAEYQRKRLAERLGLGDADTPHQIFANDIDGTRA